MIILEKGRHRAILVEDEAGLRRALGLRAAAFATDRGGSDAYDAACDHVVIERSSDGMAVGTFRFMAFDRGDDLSQSYAAQFYDLGGLVYDLGGHDGPMIELGRFCTASDDPDILRLAWGAITRRVDAIGARMIFGCTTFPTLDGAALGDAFAMLRCRHVAPIRWRPEIRARSIIPFPEGPAADPRAALAAMPPLLRSYLGMGGRTSDHAVIDHDMAAIHVFTGIEVEGIPPARKRLLRALAT